MDTSENYADKVDPMHSAMMGMIIGAYHTLTMVAPQIEKFLEAESRSHSFLHITDPTLYRDMIHSKNFADQVTLAKAAQTFLKCVERIKSDQ